MDDEEMTSDLIAASESVTLSDDDEAVQLDQMWHHSKYLLPGQDPSSWDAKENGYLIWGPPYRGKRHWDEADIRRAHRDALGSAMDTVQYIHRAMGDKWWKTGSLTKDQRDLLEYLRREAGLIVHLAEDVLGQK